MKQTLYVIIILCIGYHTRAQSQQEVLSDLDAYVERTCHYLGDCPYAIVVSRKGQVIHEKYSRGSGALGDISATSRWQLFSITKSFISALLLKLVEEKVVGLDDPLSKYFPAFRSKGSGAYDRRDVTIRHLASHTSGTAVGGVKLPADYPKDLNEIEIVTQPGKDFLYSGLGMNLLERTIEAATGKDMGDLLQTYVLQPLDLKSASYVYSETDPNGPVLPLTPGNYYFSKKGGRAGSGLFINARDLNKFGQFWLSPEKVFSNKLRDEAWTWHGTRDLDGGDYGLLWWLMKDHGGFVMSGHQYKINAVIPEREVVITVIRLPQSDSAFEFWPDKHAIVTFGGKL